MAAQETDVFSPAEVYAIRAAIRRVVPYLPDSYVMAAAGDVLDAREAKRPVRITWDMPPEVKVLIESTFNGRPSAPEPEAPETDSGPAGESLAVRRLSEVQAQEVQWLWPGKFPLRKPSTLVGNPGEGKSMISLDLTARVTTGTPWPDGSGNAPVGNVLILSAEDDPADTIRPRLEAAGADVSRVYIVEAVRRIKGGTRVFCLTEDLELLAAEIEKIGDVVLVVIDPVSAYLSHVDSHNNTEVRGVLAPLGELAAKYGPAVVTISHLNKTPGAAIYRVTGSLAFVAAARAVWACARDPHSQDYRRLMLPIKVNLAPDQEGIAYRILRGEIPRIEWGEAVRVDASEALSPDPAEISSERGEIKEWLQDRLGSESVEAATILKEARKLGFAERTLRRAAKELGVKAAKEGFQGKWSWSLPKTATDPKDCQDFRGQKDGSLCDSWQPLEPKEEEGLEL